MVENRPWLTFFCHAILIASIAVVAFPLYIAFIASTHTAERMFEIPIPLLPGGEILHNYVTVLKHGVAGASTAPVGHMMFNSLVMALTIAASWTLWIISMAVDLLIQGFVILVCFIGDGYALVQRPRVRTSLALSVCGALALVGVMMTSVLWFWLLLVLAAVIAVVVLARELHS